MSSTTMTRRSGGITVSLRARHALGAAVLAVLALLFCWLLAFHSVTVARADAQAYYAFLALSERHTWLRDAAQWNAGLCSAFPYVLLALIPVTIALVRRRWMLALAIAVMIPGALVSTELLKSVLAGHRPAIGLLPTPIGKVGSFPSGHATASMILGLALIIASPARGRRWAAALGSLFGLAVAYAVLSLGWHYPSDVVGGILVALTWTLLAVSAVLAVDARFGRDLSHLSIEGNRWRDHLPAVGPLAVTAAIGAVAVVLWRGSSLLVYAGDHVAFDAAALCVAVAGVLAPTALSYVLSGSDRAPTAARPRRWPRG